MPMGINTGCNSKEERDAYDNSRAICLHKSQNKIDGVQHFIYQAYNFSEGCYKLLR